MKTAGIHVENLDKQNRLSGLEGKIILAHIPTKPTLA